MSTTTNLPTLTTVECSQPGDPYTLCNAGVDLDVHLAGPGQRGGVGPCLCGFDRFGYDPYGRPTVGFSVGGGVTGPGYRHHPCPACARLAGNAPIEGIHAHLFDTDVDDSCPTCGGNGCPDCREEDQ